MCLLDTLLSASFRFFLYGTNDLLLLERLGFIALAGSLLSSFLVIYEPINRHVFPFLARKWFFGRVIFSPTTSMEVKHLASIGYGEKNIPVAVGFYARRALRAKPLDRTKGVITSIAYVTVFVWLIGFVSLFCPPKPMEQISLHVRIPVSIGLFFLAVLLISSLKEELKEMRLKIWLEALYLQGAEGILEFGSNFNKIEEALNINDWAAAEFWAQRWYLEGKYFPRWPTSMEISSELVQLIFEELSTPPRQITPATQNGRDHDRSP